jgi:hypothetical protein
MSSMIEGTRKPVAQASTAASQAVAAVRVRFNQINPVTSSATVPSPRSV